MENEDKVPGGLEKVPTIRCSNSRKAEPVAKFETVWILGDLEYETTKVDKNMQLH